MNDAPRNPLTLDAGWIAVRNMIDRLAAMLARKVDIDARRCARLLLDWLRPAEHLARLLICAMARTLTLAPLRPRATARAAPRRTAPRRRAFRVLLRETARGPRTTRSLRVRVRAPLRDLTLDQYFDVWVRAGCEPAPRPASTPLPLADPSRAPPPDIAGRLAALARVAGAPHLVTRRVARRLARASEAALRRLFSERRLHTDAPCLPELILAHDMAWPFGVPPPRQDSS